MIRSAAGLNLSDDPLNEPVNEPVNGVVKVLNCVLLDMRPLGNIVGANEDERAKLAVVANELEIELDAQLALPINGPVNDPVNEPVS